MPSMLGNTAPGENRTGSQSVHSPFCTISGLAPRSMSTCSFSRSRTIRSGSAIGACGTTKGFGGPMSAVRDSSFVPKSTQYMRPPDGRSFESSRSLVKT